jgi:hypothetical protein
MPSQLFHYIFDTYDCRHSFPHSPSTANHFPIQIDDQDDDDNLNEFCNIYCTIMNKKQFRIDLIGNIPITENIVDLVEIYNGMIDRSIGRLSLLLTIDQIDAVKDLAEKIKKVTFIDDDPKNNKKISSSARTLSSLYRFVRTIKEFTEMSKTKKRK